MDLRDLINKLDRIDEGIFDNDEIQQKGQQAAKDLDALNKSNEEKTSLATQKIAELNALIQRLQGAVGNVKVQESIQKQLVESFGYLIEEAAPITNAPTSGNLEDDETEFLNFLASAEKNFIGPTQSSQEPKSNSAAQIREYLDSIDSNTTQLNESFAGWIYNTFLFTFGIVEPAKVAWKNIEQIKANTSLSEEQADNLIGKEIEKVVGTFLANSTAIILSGGFLKVISKLLGFIPGPAGRLLSAIIGSGVTAAGLKGLAVWWNGKNGPGAQFGTYIISSIFEKLLSKEQIGKFIGRPLSAVAGFANELSSGEIPWGTDKTDQPASDTSNDTSEPSTGTDTTTTEPSTTSTEPAASGDQSGQGPKPTDNQSGQATEPTTSQPASSTPANGKAPKPSSQGTSGVNIGQLPAVQNIINQMIPVIKDLQQVHGIPMWPQIRAAQEKGIQAIMSVPGINKSEITNAIYS